MKLSSSWPPQAKARQPLSPVDDDDAILYAPPETSRGVRGDTYGWIPDTCCGVYHIEGGGLRATTPTLEVPSSL
jgi:hypothetical protein